MCLLYCIISLLSLCYLVARSLQVQHDRGTLDGSAGDDLRLFLAGVSACAALTYNTCDGGYCEGGQAVPRKWKKEHQYGSRATKM